MCVTFISLFIAHGATRLFFLSVLHYTVTDWEYYYPGEDEESSSAPSERQVVTPNPFDASKPKRTRASSGSVVRVFRGELTGQIGGLLRAQGLDARVLIKEFTGALALELARRELQAVGLLQSNLVVVKDKAAVAGEWITLASARSSTKLRQDNANVGIMTKAFLQKQFPFLGILGQVNLVELEENLQPNDFYRSLGVPPPKPEAVWIVYEYAGVSCTLQTYASAPPHTRRAQMPLQKGFFGNVVEPPALPAWKERANYVVNGIVKGAVEAVATLHDNGIVHRSIGRSSILVTSKTQDKMEAVSAYATAIANLRVKLTDFGFAVPYQQGEATDEEFCARARSFGLSFRPGENSVGTANFAIAEDMHALGFVVLALLLSSLAELPRADFPIPATDEDTLQRLLGEIFDKDMDQFREYVEAEDVWSNLVELLDEKDGAGWKVLETLLLAREKAAECKDTEQIFTLRGLLSSPFFQT